MKLKPFVMLQPVSSRTWLIMELKNIIVDKKTRYQSLAVVDFREYGRALVLDDLVQSSEEDEHIYHESLVHIAMISHPNPRRVLIIGGGEGATLREVLKHKTVEKAVMVDIDREVIEAAKKYLDKFHQGSFEDPRAEVIIMDGREYIRNKVKEFQVIILDLTDPYGPEISRSLYSKEFYSNVYRALSDDGIMVTQAGSSFYFEEVYNEVLENVKAVFPIVLEYNVWIPCFGYACNFIIGSKKYNPLDLSPQEVDSIIRDRGVKTLFYSGKTHIALLYTPIFRRKSYLVGKVS
ncbi:MAG TPA: polyamine aminopropyltransferase [Thermoprotei archaeon]|nr:MAG: spermidine synthase [Thermoprotei archaeon]HDI74580.1 polyamine aminopropyltransferase [Thermoprotei archaeon]